MRLWFSISSPTYIVERATVPLQARVSQNGEHLLARLIIKLPLVKTDLREVSQPA